MHDDSGSEGPPPAAGGPWTTGEQPAVRALHVRIEGVVQGVGFRWFVREYAVRLGVRGWVRNLPDGAVEVAAAGPVAPLVLLADALRRGPPSASVTAVIALPDPEDELPHPFTILRGAARG